MQSTLEDTRTHRHTAEYDALLAAMATRFRAFASERPVFVTDINPDHLWDLYLSSFPANDRQYHTCSCCRRFVKDFGGLVVINGDGKLSSAVWPDEFAYDQDSFAHYADAAINLSKFVTKAKVTSVFLSSDKHYGVKEAGGWTHFNLPAQFVFENKLLTANQKMAEKRQDFITVQRAINVVYSADALKSLMAIVNSEALYRNEKVYGPASWLYEVQTEQATFKNSRLRNNALWLRIAMAPDGFCHPTSSVIGSILDDITAGLPFADIKRKFDAKMKPNVYQRPQAAPSIGNIKAAEKVVEKLGIAPALRRRWATMEDLLETMWTPSFTKEPEAPKGGVFDHLKSKAKDAAPTRVLDIPPLLVTWDKFKRDIMPNALSIHLRNQRFLPMAALVTATDASAPPIIAWDNEDRRNPLSWYVHEVTHSTNRWNILERTVKVAAITDQPGNWFNGKFYGAGDINFLVLEGAYDMAPENGIALFPELLKPDLHGIRSTIEAHSNSSEFDPLDEGQSPIAAMMLTNNNGKCFDFELIVNNGSFTQGYRIDRWG